MENDLKNNHLCFIGNMLGRNPNNITSQGEIAADLFAAAGYTVTCASSKINKLKRLLDIIGTLIKGCREFDCVILDSYTGLNFVSSDVTGFLCRIFKIPIIVVLHGGNFPVFIQKHPRWTKRVLNRANVLVAPSEFLAKEIGEWGYEIRVITNTVDIDRYPFTERKRISPNLIWMRSFHPIYNPEMAIRVLEKLRMNGRNATLIMAGKDKGLEEGLKALASELRLSDFIKFAGFLNQSTKSTEFAKADIYLNTNRIDNMPVSVVEARALGLPVVATSVGGLPYMIKDQENGLLVPDEDIDSMVKSVELLLDNPDLTQKISRNGRKEAEESDWSKVQLEWETVLRQVVRHKRTKEVIVRVSSNDTSAEQSNRKS